MNVKRRLICLLACATLLLCGCGGKDKDSTQAQDIPDLLPVTAAVNMYNSEELRYASAVLNMTAAEDGENAESCFFSQGSYSYRTTYPVAMSGRMTQIYKGVGNTADVYYKAGAYYRSSTDSKYYLIMEKETLLAQFICMNVPVLKAEDVKGGSTAETGGGTKYTLTATVDATLLGQIFGDTLYTASGLKKAVRSKTAFSDVEYTYVVSDKGKLTSFKLTATATLYETAPYYPNYSTPDEELMHSYNLSLELSSLKTGDTVKIESPKTEDYVFLS